ncbi:MAG: hypothetical protein ABJ327_01885 [Litoreibacter sp.]
MSNLKNQLAIKAQGRWTISPEAHDVVRRMRANGCANETIAAALGMPTSTFRDHVEKDGPLAEAYGEGHAAMRDELIGICMKAARDGYVPAAFFALKTMHGMRENTPVSSADKAPTVNISIPAPMTEEQLAAMTAQMKVVSSDAVDEPVKSKPKRLIK